MSYSCSIGFEWPIYFEVSCYPASGSGIIPACSSNKMVVLDLHCTYLSQCMDSAYISRTYFFDDLDEKISARCVERFDTRFREV